MKKLLIICGPTGTGKTKLGLRLARQFHGEVVSADSRQVYKGLDICTGKDLPEQCQMSNVKCQIEFHKKRYKLRPYLVEGIPIWMYDVVKPSESFSVAHFQVLASAVITDVIKHGKLPIVVGGTGLYLKALTQSLDALYVPPDLTLRKKMSSLSIEQLHQKLQGIDSARLQKMNESDKRNPRRLIRAIEVAVWRRSHRSGGGDKGKSRDILWVGLTAPNDALRTKIIARVADRWERAVSEVKTYLLEKRNDAPQGETIIGLPILATYLRGNMDKESAIASWVQKEYQYAKRQMTWFSSVGEVTWFDNTKLGVERLITHVVSQWYTKRSV